MQTSNSKFVKSMVSGTTTSLSLITHQRYLMVMMSSWKTCTVTSYTVSQEFVDPKSFKTYDELKDKLNKVLTGTSVRGTVETFTPKTSVDKAVEKVEEVKTDDDETLQYFAKLADEA